METTQKEDARLPETATPGRIAPAGSFRNVLRNRPFVLLWLAQLVSQIGFNAANYGLIATVTEITGSTIMVALAIISFTFPAVPFSLLAGVYVDYLDKRMVMWVSNVLRAVASILIVLALVWNPHTVLPLFFLTFLISMITQFFMPAEASAIPSLVGTQNLVPALSLFSITLNVAQAIGFLLLGRLIESFFSPFTIPLGLTTLLISRHDMLFAIIAVSYLLCTLLILAIPRTKLSANANNTQRLPRSPGKEMWAIVQRDIKGSWQFVRKDRNLFLAIIQVSAVNILLLVIGELAGPFVKRVLNLPVDDLTLLFAPAGFGLVLGGLVMPLLARYLKKPAIITLGSVLTAASLILLPISQLLARQLPFLQPWALFIVGMLAFIIGIALDMIIIPAQTVVQERAPEEERARVLSFQFMLSNAGSIPVLLFAGVISDTLGINTVMYGLGIAILLFLGWSLSYVNSAKARSESSPGENQSE
jgi:Na+/melibiose symporter-like transporter